MWPFSNKVYSCAKEGDIENLNKLIQAGQNVNKTKLGVSPLKVAVDRGHDEVVDILLASGADPNTTTPLMEETPLHAAVKSGRLKIAASLIQAKAEINTVDINQDTPLHLAARLEDEGMGIEMTRILMLGHADPIRLNKDQDAPLTLALASKREDMIFTMIEGLEVDQVNSAGWNVLHIICENGDVKWFTALVEKGVDLMAVTPDNQAPIHLAAFHRRDEILTRLLEMGVDVNLKGKDDLTPLHAACWSGTSAAVKQLLERGADVTAETMGSGLTPLMIITTNECQDKLELLARWGVDIMAVHPQNGFTLLHQAVVDDNPELVQAAIKAGFDTEVLSEKMDGYPVQLTPLHVACINNSKKAADALIKAGANVNHIYVDELGRWFTPMQLARAHKNYILTSIISQAGGKWFTEDVLNE